MRSGHSCSGWMTRKAVTTTTGGPVATGAYIKTGTRSAGNAAKDRDETDQTSNPEPARAHRVTVVTQTASPAGKEDNVSVPVGP